MKTRPATTATGVRPGATSTRVACLTPAGPQPSRTKRVQKGNTRHDFELYYMTLAYPHAIPNGTTPTYPHELFNEDQADYHHYMTQGYGKGARTKRGQGECGHSPPARAARTRPRLGCMATPRLRGAYGGPGRRRHQSPGCLGRWHRKEQREISGQKILHNEDRGCRDEYHYDQTSSRGTPPHQPPPPPGIILRALHGSSPAAAPTDLLASSPEGGESAATSVTADPTSPIPPWAFGQQVPPTTHPPLPPAAQHYQPARGWQWAMHEPRYAAPYVPEHDPWDVTDNERGQQAATSSQTGGQADYTGQQG